MKLVLALLTGFVALAQPMSNTDIGKLVPKGESFLLVLRMKPRAANIRIYGEAASKMYEMLVNVKRENQLTEEMGVVKDDSGNLVTLKYHYRISNDDKVNCWMETAEGAKDYPQYRCEMYIDSEDGSVHKGIFDE